MKRIDEILNLITGSISPADKKTVLSEIKEDQDKKVLYRKAKLAWAFISSTKDMPSDRVDKSFKEIQDRIKLQKSTSKIILFRRYAAVLVAFVGISMLMFYLGKGSLFGLWGEDKYTSVVAEYGQMSKVILPDSSVVWLNSGTVLKYNNDYAESNREIILSGQAFLKVKKNKSLPLIVSSGDLKVKVLGTRFDVCAYPDENVIDVVLVSGSVQLLNEKNRSFNYKLDPGEKATYNKKTGVVKINEIVAWNYTAWRKGELVFIDAPMSDVIKRLERKFDIEVIVKNPNVYKSVFTANFTTENLKEILDYIQFSSPLTYVILEEENKKSKLKVTLN